MNRSQNEGTLHREVHNFLSQESMLYLDISPDELLKSFLDEMENGLKGEESSLDMIPTYIEGGEEVPHGKKVIVLDAGGTNLRRALVSFNDKGEPVIEQFKKRRMPGYEKEVSLVEFYDILAEWVGDLAPQADTIGFCFSYPSEISPEKDGKPLLFSKEIKAKEVLGSWIGDNLRDALERQSLPCEHKVIVLNDTVATLLTGMASGSRELVDDYVGFIVGTGLNSCYLEANENITKAGSLPKGKRQAINVEIGKFTAMKQGSGDQSFDSKTQQPGLYFLEKMVSGGYFGALCWETIQLAITKGLFSKEMADALNKLDGLSTIYADNYLHSPLDQSNPLSEAVALCGIEQQERLYYLIDALLERAAFKTAGAMAAALLKCGRGHSPLKPVCITVDGTTYWAYNRFPYRVEKWLGRFLTQENKRYYKIIKVEDAPLLGAAIAALTN